MRRKLVLEVFLALSLVPFTSNAAERHHYGDLVLRGTQTLTVDADTLYVHGNVYLYDSSVLTVRNRGSVILVQTYHWECSFFLHNDAQLIISKGVLKASFDFGGVILWDSASLTADEANIDHEIEVADNSRVTLYNASIRMLGIAFPGYQRMSESRCEVHVIKSTITELALSLANDCEVKLVGLRPGHHAEFTMTSGSARRERLPFLIMLSESDIGRVNVSVARQSTLHLQKSEIFQLHCMDRATIFAEDCVIHQPVLQLLNTYAVLDGLLVGDIVDWTLRPSSGWVPCNITLRNTQILQGWYLRLRGGRVEIRNAVIARLLGEFDEAASNYKLVNCCVQEWMPWWNHGTVVLENCVLGVIQTPDGATPTLKGNFCVLEPVVSEFWGPWRNNSTITREFPVVVRAADGRPAPNVAVELRDARGQLLQTRYTDQNGQAFVTIAFNERNYRDAWALRVPQFGWEQSISLTSSTPILFPVASPPCPDLPCREQLRVGPAGKSGAGSSLKNGEPFLDWNETHVLSRSFQTIAEDAALDIVALSAMTDETFLYLRMELRGSAADVPSQSATYNFYLSCREWEWGEVRHYHISVGHGELWTVMKTGAGQYKVVESRPVECRATSRAVEVAIPRSLVAGITLLDVRAETRASSGKTVDFIQGFLRVPGQS